MKKQSKALTVTPATAVSTIQNTPAKPKVTKTEAIKAAVERARQLHKAAVEAYHAKVEEFNSRLKEAAAAHIVELVASGEPLSPDVRIQGDWGSLLGTVQVTFDLDTPELRDLLKENKKLAGLCPVSFCPDAVVRKLKDKLDTSEERISLILRDEENVRVIDALLDSLK